MTRHDCMLCTYRVSVAGVVSFTIVTQMLLAYSAEPPASKGIRMAVVTPCALPKNFQHFYFFLFISSPALQVVFCEDTVHTHRRPCLSMDNIGSSSLPVNLVTRYTPFLVGVVLPWWFCVTEVLNDTLSFLYSQ